MRHIIVSTIAASVTGEGLTVIQILQAYWECLYLYFFLAVTCKQQVSVVKVVIILWE